MSNSSRPRLLPALILSLLLHALLLFGVFSELSLRLAAPAALLEVTLAAQASAVAVLPAPAPAARPPARSTVVPRADRREQKRSLLVAPVSARVPEGAASTADSRHSIPLPTDDGVTADDLRAYRISLAIAARPFKHYPAVARARGWEGAPELALSISPHWPAPEVVVVRSSGYPVLDTQAREMMARAARTTALPERLQGRSFRVPLSVQFSLDDDQ